MAMMIMTCKGKQSWGWQFVMSAADSNKCARQKETEKRSDVRLLVMNFKK
jgi:hypothetical protein